jgi:hypothetical protein
MMIIIKVRKPLGKMKRALIKGSPLYLLKIPCLGTKRSITEQENLLLHFIVS